MPAQACCADLVAISLASLLEAEQNLVGTRQCNIGPGLVLVILDDCQRVLGLFSKLEVFRPSQCRSPALSILGLMAQRIASSNSVKVATSRVHGVQQAHRAA